MNILFLTLFEFNDINQGGIYPDLMKCFVEQGHHVTILSPLERRHKKKSFKIEGKGFEIIRVKTLNIQKTNFIEKIFGTLSLDYVFRNAFKKKITSSSIDLLIYSTPPITLVNSIASIKKKYNPFSYLLLKDIFPQNAVDLSIIKKGGLPYQYFRNKEKKLYQYSDKIGCMSVGNVNYLRQNNKDLPPEKIEVCPNSIFPQEQVISDSKKKELRQELNLPLNKRIFFYGGNLGLPQGIPFIIKFLESQLQNKKAFYIIAGSGTKYKILREWIDKIQPENIILYSHLPQNDYNNLLKIGDVGLIFLDNRFTIPNYPSRILPYLDNGLPVVAAIDKNTDIGDTITKNNIGKASIAGNLESLNKNIEYFCSMNDKTYSEYSKRARNYLLENDTVHHSTQIILNAVNKNQT